MYVPLTNKIVWANKQMFWNKLINRWNNIIIYIKICSDVLSLVVMFVSVTCIKLYTYNSYRMLLINYLWLFNFQKISYIFGFRSMSKICMFIIARSKSKLRDEKILWCNERKIVNYFTMLMSCNAKLLYYWMSKMSIIFILYI